jgi:quinone-modifying oxidoreductase subunit QmoB
MELKNVCFLCKGCGIGDALDLEDLAKVVKSDGKIPEVKEVDVLCAPEGIEAIKAEIAEGATGVLLGACSARVKTDEFSFGDVMVERAPLREQVVWALEDSYEDEEEEGEDRLMAAEDYMRMHAIKLTKSKPTEPYQVEGEICETILVVGGGPAGLSAALESAKAGKKVVLVEKEAELGGFQAKMAKLGPQSAPYQELEENNIASVIESVTGNDAITVYTGATVAKTKGMPGAYDVELSNGESVKIGAVVQATGWLPYEPENLKDELSYGSHPDIITNVDMEAKAKAGGISRSDGSAVNAVAFVQCAGSRDQNHLPYCSAFCCLVSLKQAMYVKEQNPEAAVYVVYKDIRTPDQSEEVYRQAQAKGVIFIRREEEYPSIKEAGGKLNLVTKDVLLNDEVELEELDLVVLATGMKPNNPKVVDMPLIPFDMPDEEGKKLAAEAKSQCDDWSVLNLDYRQGPNLPTIKYAMPDSHFICFPYETRRTGIYAAGAVRRPMRLTRTVEDGAGAALKAIQAIHGAEVGQAVHPRSGDMTFPEFAMQRCTQCKRCTEECPFGAINEDEKANPIPNITRCRRCGTCMGACPERIIGFGNYNIDMIGSMIKVCEVPDEDEEKPRILVLACENDALPAIEMATKKGHKLSPWLRIIPMRCLGSVNLIWIADTLSNGFDGVLLMGCRPGDDYQCHFVKGSELANVRMSKIAETLDRLMLESERVRVEEIAINDSDRVIEVIDEFAEMLDDLGPNPMKDF